MSSNDVTVIYTNRNLGNPTPSVRRKIWYCNSLNKMSKIGAGVAGSRMQRQTCRRPPVQIPMAADQSVTVSTWRNDLPELAGRFVVLREPTGQDLAPLLDLLMLGDATRFGVDQPATDVGVHELIERA